MNDARTADERADGGGSSATLDDLEIRTQALGREILRRVKQHEPSVFERRWWDERLMQWSMRDERLKVNLFRFVDVLPMLESNDEVVRHLNEYLSDAQQALPVVLKTGLGLSRHTSLARVALARAARLAATDLARRFIAGTNEREVLRAAQRERQRHRAFTLDILGEAVTSDFEAEGYFRAYADLITSLAPQVNAWPADPRVDEGVFDTLPRFNLSIKLSALDSQYDAVDPEGAVERAGQRLRELLRIARRHNAFINVDMESYATKDLTLHVFKTILAEDEFRDMGDVGIVVQAYLVDSEADLISLRNWAAARGKPIWVRLVKGAYWDYETTHAKATGWPVPVFQQKWQSDANFERLTRLLVRNHEWLRPALGSHNVRSLAHSLAVAQQLELPKNGIELQMLYGMGDAEKQVLTEMGYRVRVYMPYGELIPGMAYLVRRLLENTSNDSFLRMEQSEGLSEKLLRRPEPAQEGVTFDARRAAYQNPAARSPAGSSSPVKRAESTMSGSAPSPTMRATFQNQPPVDFSKESNRLAMREALDRVLMQLGRQHPLVIGGERVETASTQDSIDPSHHARIVGTVHQAGAIEADAAVQAAAAAQAGWRDLGAEGRAPYLREVAEILRERLFDLAAIQVYECAKGWREATNDICEAIDFCNFYADRAIRLEQPHGADVPGEENRFEYLPIGVAAVIAPWNFPLAILTGMTTAALATGNTVVMKPAEQSSVIAAKLMDIFLEVGLPEGVLNYLPGKGEVAGAALVEHPRVGLIAFTGSREVGLWINRRAAEISAAGQMPFVKRVIAEMGGKNAIIVDRDADLDEAVLGVVKSAFGYQGQKCSACSRAIVLDDVYDAFLKRLVEATRSLKVGPPEDPASSIGPVIDEAACKKVRDYIALGRQEGREVLSGDVGDFARQGYFIGPHIFADVAPDSRLAQEEVFGPVLAVIRAKDLDDAIRIANGTAYALTAGVFSRSPANLDRTRRELIAGNIYLNRGITGALVGRQPFGGFKMSGIGSKAGGDDYLLQYVLPRTITENTMRRGFAPDAD